MTTRGIRRKKSYLAEIKVAVIGAPCVGKSALTVRFLTKRYIGEYDHQAGNYRPTLTHTHLWKIIKFLPFFSLASYLRFPYFPIRWDAPVPDCDACAVVLDAAENRHKYEIMVDGEAVLCEIWDTCPKIEENTEAVSLTAGSEAVQWADGLLLVYSITDRDSFNYIRKAKEELAGDTPVALVGNKVDMVHLRQVSTDEGDILAKDFECKFFEISAAEHVYQVAEAFLELCREVLTSKRKSKQSFIDKIDRMLSGSRTYNRGKSDSISPKE
uniref:small monomeric GTPase n=1 Tax=Anopheles farauti TaxID=69004 RepID=A0A182Q202_9DIPT